MLTAPLLLQGVPTQAVKVRTRVLLLPFNVGCSFVRTLGARRSKARGEGSGQREHLFCQSTNHFENCSFAHQTLVMAANFKAPSYWRREGETRRRWCEFCKVWMSDNKVGIEGHESGKKHKEAVQEKLKIVSSSHQSKKIKTCCSSFLFALPQLLSLPQTSSDK